MEGDIEMLGTDANTDADAPLEIENNGYMAVVPGNTVDLPPELLTLLEQEIDIFRDDGTNGKVAYQLCVQFVQSNLSRDNH